MALAALTMDHSVTEENASRENSRPRSTAIVQWLLTTLAAAAIVGLVVYQVPARWRLIGLLAVGQGLGCGWIFAKAGFLLRMRTPAIAVFGGAVLGASSVILSVLLWWQSYAKRVEADFQSSEGAVMALRILNAGEDSGDEETQQNMREYRQALKQAGALKPDTSFLGFLSHRTSGIGSHNSLGPGLFGVEIFLAACAAAWLARNSAGKPFCETCQNWILRFRSHRFEGSQPQQITELLDLRDGAWTDAVVWLSRCDCEGKRPHVGVAIGNREGGDMVIAATEAGSLAPIGDNDLASLTSMIDTAEGLHSNTPPDLETGTDSAETSEEISS